MYYFPLCVVMSAIGIFLLHLNICIKLANQISFVVYSSLSGLYYLEIIHSLLMED